MITHGGRLAREAWLHSLGAPHFTLAPLATSHVALHPAGRHTSAVGSGEDTATLCLCSTGVTRHRCGVAIADSWLNYRGEDGVTLKSAAW